jgi:hypothetical protein
MGKRLPPEGSRNWLAWIRAEEMLADGEWHYTSMVEEAMTQAGDITRKTAQNLLTEAVGWKVLERKGRKHGVGHAMMDDRMVRLIPAKEARIARERAGHVGDQGLSPVTRRVTALQETASARPDFETPRTQEIARKELTDPPLPPPNEDVHVEGRVIDTSGPLTDEDLAELARRKRAYKEAQAWARKQGRRTRNDPPGGYGH